jgi:hypothetical protein
MKIFVSFFHYMFLWDAFDLLGWLMFSHISFIAFSGRFITFWICIIEFSIPYLSISSIEFPQLIGLIDGLFLL